MFQLIQWNNDVVICRTKYYIFWDIFLISETILTKQTQNVEESLLKYNSENRINIGKVLFEINTHKRTDKSTNRNR